jgi:type I restriction enzyme S subunit
MKKGWQTARLGDLIELISGQHIDSKDYNTSGRGVGYLTGPSDFGPIYPVVTKWTEHPKIKAKKNDILITVKGSGVGKVNLMDADEVAISRQLMAIRVVNAERQFVYLLLESVFDHFQEESTGAAIPGISREQVLGLQIPLPPLPEQQRIVGVLDEAFASLATAQAHAAQNLQNARALFESHLNAIFTQRGKGWVEKTLGDICDFVGGSQPPKAVFSKTKTPNSIRLIQIRDYKSDNHVVYIPKAQARRFCTVDDIMIGRYGPPIFQILRGLEGAYNVALMKAVPDEAQVNREFLFYFLKHPAILEYVIYHSERAAGQIGVTKETLAPYPIAMPSLDKQVTVAANINALAAETQRLTRIYEQKLAALAALKKSLLHQAFSGEL